MLRDFAAATAALDRRTPEARLPGAGLRLAGEGLGGWARERLLRKDGKLAELLDPGAASATLERAIGGDRHAAHQVWSLIVLDDWLERWT